MRAPCSRRQRCGTLLSDLEEHGGGHVTTWPQLVARLVLKDGTLTRGQRFAITLFFLGNGAHPIPLAAYLSGAGLLADRSARSHM